MTSAEDIDASAAARLLSWLGASKGGKARAAKLSPERRKEIARNAVNARWAKSQKQAASPSDMTNPNDITDKPHIVQIVKDLQEVNDQWLRCEYPTHKYTALMEINFPKVAQALLIAVDELEKIAKPRLGGKTQQYMAQAALSCIRSLPPQA